METRIGAGAQGEVWRGRRTDARETLAFKVLRAELVENPDVVERFIKERSTLLRVRSPYVVAIRDVVIEGSTFAIVMDYVNGGDLRDLLRAYGCLPPAQVASLGTRIAQGLSSVHQAGVIHRDIKPANVLLSSRPSRGGDPAETVVVGVAPGGEVPETVVPRLADFGVARIVEQNLVTIDPGMIEAARAMGASPWQIITGVIIREALGPLVLGYTFCFIAIVDMSAMAGYIGGGGLGDFAITKGYRAFNLEVTYVTTFMIIIIVQIAQLLGNWLSRKIMRR